MKCFIVFNSSSKVVFFRADDEFKQSINEKQGEVEVEKDAEGVNMNSVAQLFLPLFASQACLLSAGNPYSSLSCEDGVTYVFHQFSDLTCIAVSGDHGEDEAFLRRKVHVFQSLVGFFYGPAIDELNPSMVNERHRRWKLLGDCLDMWSKLWKTDQAFLVEALEMLLVRKDLNARCIQLLEQSLRMMKGVEEATAAHTLLLVGTKLLALYSSTSASELNSADTMLITVLARNLFPAQHPAASTPPVEEDAPVRSESLMFATPIQEVYFSPTSTPLPPLATTTEFLTPHGDASFSIHPRSQLEKEFGGVEPILEEPASRDSPVVLEGDDVENDQEVEGILSKDTTFGSIHNEEQTEDKRAISEPVSISSSKHPSWIGTGSQAEEKQPFYRYNVFLQTPVCPFMPHLLHCLEVMPGTVLVIISEVPRGQLSALLCHVLNRLSPLRSVVDSNSSKELLKNGPKSSMEFVENNIKRIADSAKRLVDSTGKKPRGSAGDVQQNLTAKWESLKDIGLQEFLEKLADEVQLAPVSVPYAIDDHVGDIMHLLRHFFRDLFCHHKKLFSDKLKDCMAKIQHTLHRALKDHEEFLNIKALRNVPAGQYQADFPGLIHFIHVDRTTDQVTVPSLDLYGLESNGGDQSSELTESGLPVGILKEKVWKMCKLFHGHLIHGCTSGAVREGDFLYSYHLWFEDTAGTTLPWDEPARIVGDCPLPGILAGPFYKELHRSVCSSHRLPPGAIHCYELMCIHVGVVSMQHAAKQAKRLANAIWETSAVNSPMNLL